MPKRKAKALKERVVAVAVPTIMHPHLCRAVEVLCRESIQYSANNSIVRQAIGALIVTMRQQAERVHGRETPDIKALSALLDRTRPQLNGSAPARLATLDPIAELFRQRHLLPEHVAAALFIRSIWLAWGRYLDVAARSYEPSGGSGGRGPHAPDPVAAMGPNILNEWHHIYVPWVEMARKLLIPARGERSLSAAQLVLCVVDEPIFPGALDIRWHLKKGTSLRVLREQLGTLATLQEKGKTLWQED